MTNRKRPLIRASELTQYGFCRRAWWLRTVKKRPAAGRAAQIRGRRRHEQHARQVWWASRWQGFGLILIGGGCVLMAMVLWLWLF